MRQKSHRAGGIYSTDRLCAGRHGLGERLRQKYGLTLQPSKEASWAAVRDKLISGELDAAHVLYSMIYGLQLGVAGPQHAMANLMTLNNNGAISCRTSLKRKRSPMPPA